MWDLEPLLEKLEQLQLYFYPQLVTQGIVIMFNLHTDLGNQDTMPIMYTHRDPHTSIGTFCWFDYLFI